MDGDKKLVQTLLERLSTRVGIITHLPHNPMHLAESGSCAAMERLFSEHDLRHFATYVTDLEPRAPLLTSAHVLPFLASE